MTVPPRTPPPANNAVKAGRQWSRPASLLIRGLGGPLQGALLALDLPQQARAVVQAQAPAFGQAEHRRLEDGGGGVLEGRAVEAEAVGTGPVAQGAARGHVDVPRLPARAEPAG